MRKILLATAFLFLFISNSYTQTASDYFPANPGFKWYYSTTSLDSNNNPVPGSLRYRVDSFSVVQSYNGLSAHYAPSKSNLSSIFDPGPYTDTNFYNFQGSNGWQYVDVTRGLDSITFLDTSGLINFIASFNKWYSVYRFASTVNQEYTIFTKDTTITFNSQSFPIRIAYKGKRLSDEASKKRFVLTASLHYLLELPPPLPPIPVEVLSRRDSVWLSLSFWMVREVIPSINVDLNQFSIPVAFIVPGEKIELQSGPLGVINYSGEVPQGYSLEQNFPNPFNPETNIKYSLPEEGFVSLKVYDLAGKEAAVLINQEQRAGTYELNFDASGLTSGIYFYTLEAGSFTQTKKLTLIK
jgi:hypothetical protein